MPSPEQAFEDLERDRAKREAEVRLIERYFQNAPADHERDILARTLVLLAYAHVEGFTKFALITYAEVVNGLKLPCDQAALPLVAATLGKLFAALRDVNAKHPMFRDLPGNHDVQLQARHVEFIASYDAVMAHVVEIPESAIDTGANLNSRVLRRVLFQMGIDSAALEHHHDTLNRLLGERNAIAHGDILRVPRREQVEAYLATAFKIMQFIQHEVFNAVRSGAYRRGAAGAA